MTYMYMYQPNVTHFFEIWKTPLCGVHKGLEKAVSEKRPYMIFKQNFPYKRMHKQ